MVEINQNCNDNTKITKMLVVNINDLVFAPNGNIVRIKRKYGKYKRPIIKVI
jgi:hypothetical protein